MYRCVRQNKAAHKESREHLSASKKGVFKVKRFLAKALAVVMLIGVCPMAANADAQPYINAGKTNWIVGTGGTLETIGAEESGYTSDDENVVAVNADGTFEAKSAGTAKITSSTGASIDLTVYDKETRNIDNNIVDDIGNGKLTYSYNERFSKMSELRNGSDLYAYMSSGGTSIENGNKAVFSGNNGDATGCIGFIYKIQPGAKSITVNTRKYISMDEAKKRTEIGFISDGSQEFTTPADGNHSLDSDRLTQYATEFALIGSSWAAPVGLSDMWTKADLSNAKWYATDADERDVLIDISDVPSNAEYVAVFINLGNLKDGTPLLETQQLYGYKGMQVRYSSLKAGEFSADNKALITFSGVISSDKITVKKNRVEVKADVSFDKDTYTLSVDGGFAAGDLVTVDTLYGTWIASVPSNSSEIDYDDIYFNTDKTYYIVGNTGKIDLITEKDGEKKYDLLPTEYTSSNEDVLSIDNKGNFTAKAAGEAVITPSVTSLDLEFEPITIDVFEKAGEVRSYFTEDWDAGTLTVDYERGVKMSEKRNGTKLWSYAASGPFYNAGEQGTLIGSGAKDEYMAFVYKLDGDVESLQVHTWGYGNIEGYTPDRTDIGYLTDDTVTFGDRNGDGAFTWSHPDLQWWATEGGTVGNAQAPIKLNENIWTKVSADDCIYKYDADKSAYITTSALPAGAKYVVVLLKEGTLEDGTAPLTAQFYRYKGITINYKNALVGKELNNDGKVVLTMNADVSNIDWTVKVNGSVIENPEISYDKNTFTYYIGGFSAGDSVEVSSEYGSFAAVISDGRAQITSIVLKNADGEAVDEMLVDDTEYTVDMTVVKGDGAKAYAALYDKNGKLVKCIGTAVESDAASLKLDGITISEGYTLKVFCWNDMTPYAIYNDSVTNTFNTADF